MVQQQEFIVSIDFGTTYSSVSCHRRSLASADEAATFENSYVHPGELIHITGYPRAGNKGKIQVTEVPTEMLYITGAQSE